MGLINVTPKSITDAIQFSCRRAPAPYPSGYVLSASARQAPGPETNLKHEIFSIDSALLSMYLLSLGRGEIQYLWVRACSGSEPFNSHFHKPLQSHQSLHAEILMYLQLHNQKYKIIRQLKETAIASSSSLCGSQGLPTAASRS